MKIKLILIAVISLFISACQLVSPIFVNYNGVRMDVAKWINSQTLLSMQQKRSLAQLSKAQQKLVNIDHISVDEKLTIAKENLMAMHCAHLHVSDKKIVQLQNQIFGENEKIKILEKFKQNFPKLKLDPDSIQCD